MKLNGLTVRVSGTELAAAIRKYAKGLRERAKEAVEDAANLLPSDLGAHPPPADMLAEESEDVAAFNDVLSKHSPFSRFAPPPIKKANGGKTPGQMLGEHVSGMLERQAKKLEIMAGKMRAKDTYILHMEDMFLFDSPPRALQRHPLG